jgi:hypothetical protein
MVVRITGSTPCNLNLDKSGGGAANQFYFRHNLAIVTDWSISLAGKSFNGQNGTRKLFLMRDYDDPITPTAAQCGAIGTFDSATAATPRYDIAFSQQTTFSQIEAMVYTPCEILSNNQNATFKGQLIAGQAATTGQSFGIGYVPMVAPGFDPAGYQASPIFLREIRNT